MNILLLTISLVAGLAALQTGTVAGVVRDAAGEPQIGVRVAVMAAPDANGQNSRSEVLVSIGQTNEAGRYRLEVPPGRYYIVLGRVERPTYYPGVGGPEGATVIPITPGLAVNELDFVVSRLTGVVRDSAGNPEWGISVAAVDASDAKPLSNCGGALPNATDRYISSAWERSVAQAVISEEETAVLYPTNRAHPGQGPIYRHRL